MALRPTSLIAIDLPGHGHSDGPGERQRTDRSPRGAAGDVAVAIRALAPEARGVVGMSYGGLTTIALTETAPELVRKIAAGRRAARAQRRASPPHRRLRERPGDVSAVRRPPGHGPSSSIHRGASRHCGGRSTTTRSSSTTEVGCGVIRVGDSTLGEQSPVNPSTAGAAAPCSMTSSKPSGASASPCSWPVACGPTRCSATTTKPSSCGASRRPQVVHFEEAGHSIQGDMPVALATTIRSFIF